MIDARDADPVVPTAPDDAAERSIRRTTKGGVDVLIGSFIKSQVSR